MAAHPLPCYGNSFKDITGLKKGLLTAIEPVDVRHGTWRWRFRCECGGEKVCSANAVKSGLTQSCGCLQKANAYGMSQANRTHSRCRTPEYRIWTGIKTRCFNAKEPNFRYYGGRGISICERWLDSFENFFADMGPRPSPQHSIDRIDNEQGYSPDNCRWATRIEQARNKRPRVSGG